MKDIFYKTLHLLGSPFAYDCIGLKNIQSEGPAIYVTNHLGSVGPIAVILSLPIRFYPWVIAEMLDYQRAPQYLYDDFVHPELHLDGRFGMVVASFISQISVRLLNVLGSVSVDRNRGYYMSPMRQSLAMLVEGKNLLILPEDPLGPLDPEHLMRPFLCGFLLLCFKYKILTNGLLPVYPLAVSSECKKVCIGHPLFFESQDPHPRYIRQFCHQLQDVVKGLYQDLQASLHSPS
jgi:hypothetical protein